MRFGFFLLALIFMAACSNGDLTSTGRGAATAKKRVFVSSGLYTGNLGGLTGADSICQNLANAVGLNGTFKAWLSISGTSASNRIADVSPWYLVDQTSLVFSKYPSASVFPLVAINMTESGGAPGGSVQVWTGTTVTGSSGSSFCLGGTWTSSSSAGEYGDRTMTTATWTTSSSTSCAAATGRLYCFEQ